MSHNSKIKDTETHFIIDPSTRTVTNESSSNNIIVQYDHNSERFTFEMPRYVDGHDMAESTEVRVQYINSASTGMTKTPGVYICDDLAIDPEDENLVTFSWLLSSAATQYIGFLYFSIQFVCLNGDEVEYAWNTGIYKDIVIIESINNGESAMTNNVDALIAYRNTIIEQVSAGITNGRIGYVDILANKWVGGSSPYSQVVQIEGVTENTQVDLTPSVEQLAVFHNKDLAFVTANTGGTVTVYAVGQRPANNYNIQVTMKEVVAESNTIIGVTVGTPMSMQKIDKDLAHIADTNNPHEVKIGQIGAAPAGYGYGENLPIVTGSTDEEFLANIEALCAEKIKFSTFQVVIYPPEVAFDGNSFIAQIWQNSDNNGNKFIKINAHGTTSSMAFQRVCYGSTWSEPEWENPPMLSGVVYRTTERHNGAPVYTACIYYGKGSSTGSFNINTHTVTGTNVKYLDAFCKADNPSGWSFNIDGLSYGEYGSGAAMFSIIHQGDLSGHDIYLTVKYYKV